MWSGEAAEGPAQQLLVDAGMSRTGQCGTGVGGQLGPGAEVAVRGVLVAKAMSSGSASEVVSEVGALTVV